MTDAAPRQRDLVALLDPVAEVLRGAVPYTGAPIDLPDDQPLPSLRVRREVTAPGCTLRVTHLRGDDVLTDEPLTVTRVPLDRATARPRRRVHPAPTSVLSLVTDRDGHRERAEVISTDVAAEGFVPRSGPAPRDLALLASAAREYRAVRVDAPLAGDPVLVAALLVRLAAGGTPAAWASAATADLDLVHPELRAAVTIDPATVATDDLALAATAAEQRRAAWLHHDLTLTWGADGTGGAHWTPRLEPPRWPAVSIVLPTRRPGLLPAALAMIAAQRGVDLEVVVALHGQGDVEVARRELGAHGLTGDVLAVPAAVPFGAVLNAAVARTSAPLVLKWDDDDLYGPAHLQDLLVAQRQTGAALVGKAPEFVYLQATDTTIWRTPGKAEAPSVGLAGGTFLTPRAVLDDLGGYPPVGRAVDHHLKTRLADAGELVFRTHGFGFVLRRHAAGHTWEADDSRFTQRAVVTLAGLPSVLGLGDAARFGREVDLA